MLGIVISDDDRFTVSLSEGLINECIAAHKLEAEIVCVTTNYNEVGVFLKNNRAPYLYFLDIDFGGQKLNGVDVARRIKQIEPMSKIVFVTSHDEMALKVLKSGVEPFGFIEKRYERREMMADYTKYIRMAIGSPNMKQPDGASGEAGSISIPVGIDEYIDLDINRILYVEAIKTISHFVCYHSVDGSAISVRDTIENVLKRLGKGFMKSHRSVIVNTSYVVGVTDGSVNFSNGESAACSFRLKNDVIKRCIK
jgi:DNA-binding LytR/AlgR family response regulator